MAWLHDLRDTVQEVLEWASSTPCTCLGRLDELTGERCMAHRAYGALGGLYWYGVPTRRFPRQLTPRYLPAHRVLVAHDWRWRDVGHGGRERSHHVDGCRIWCQDCGAIAPGGCTRDATPPVQRGEVLYWWADYGWSRSYASGLEEPKACTWLLHRHFELAPRPSNAPEFLNDLRDSEGEDRRLLPSKHRRSG